MLPASVALKGASEAPKSTVFARHSIDSSAAADWLVVHLDVGFGGSVVDYHGVD